MLCSGGTSCATATSSNGGYKDFNGKACEQDGQCVPRGVCRPLTLKVVAQTVATDGAVSAGDLKVYDLDWSPDERPTDDNGIAMELRGRLGATFLAPSSSSPLDARFATCIEAFSNIVDENADGNRDNWFDDSGEHPCPAPLGNWWRQTGGSTLWWNVQ